MECPHCHAQRPATEILYGTRGRPFYLLVSPSKRSRSSIAAGLKKQISNARQGGAEAASGETWDYKDVVVPLGLGLPRGSRFTDEFEKRCEVLAQHALAHLRNDGWQPDGPTSLRALGPERFTTRPARLLKRAVRDESATLRLKRPRRD